ncbi:MAG: helix-turn-helix transcriptional regulator [Nitrospirota bacterium]
MAQNYTFQEIGKRIRELRGNDRQKDWAARIGCDQGYISQVENGVTKPSLAFLRQVTVLTNASIDWILTGRGEKLRIEQGPDSFTIEFMANAGGNALKELQGNPRLLQAVDRLLKEEKGRVVLEAMCEMEAHKINGLAQFMGVCA